VVLEQFVAAGYHEPLYFEMNKSMKEKKITEVAKILEVWNPLGERANSVEDLHGYRYEAMDIISTAEIMYSNSNFKKAVKQVLDQAFDLSVDGPELEKASKEIEKIIKNTTM